LTRPAQHLVSREACAETLHTAWLPSTDQGNAGRVARWRCGQDAGRYGCRSLRQPPVLKSSVGLQEGQVITGFAKNEDGKRNDGIDISMPTGTPVKAAENGVVIYSGDGLKEYGKTVLIRHDDGLVTVYAHANDLHVKRGDKIARGQVIASSGMTGVAKTPRLHFEVRKNASPVDPMGYLE
jgi:murein DD-endopeptidase MepM/ murein hydrolase activator NlpD